MMEQAAPSGSFSFKVKGAAIENSQEPVSETPGWIIAMKIAESLNKGFLADILRILTVAKETQG